MQVSDEKSAGVQELVTFRVSEQEYCVDIMSVKEIRGWTPATPLPNSPEFVEGVINLRGSVLPIVNLGVRLGIDLPPPTSRNVIMIVQRDGNGAGFLVDAVSDILTIQESQMQAAPEIGSVVSRGFIKGVFALDDRMVRYIDLMQVLPAKEESAA